MKLITHISYIHGRKVFFNRTNIICSVSRARAPSTRLRLCRCLRDDMRETAFVTVSTPTRGVEQACRFSISAKGASAHAASAIMVHSLSENGRGAKVFSLRMDWGLGPTVGFKVRGVRMWTWRIWRGILTHCKRGSGYRSIWIHGLWRLGARRSRRLVGWGKGGNRKRKRSMCRLRIRWRCRRHRPIRDLDRGLDGRKRV